MPKDNVSIKLDYDTAAAIAAALKVELRNLDLELRKAKERSLGETTIAVMKDRRKQLRAAYDALKRAGVATDATTIVNDW